MKRLAHFTLEGLMQQGPHSVWIPLGTFASAELANEAKAGLSRSDIVESRVMALYRDNCVEAVAQNYVTPAFAGEPVTVDNVTVA